MVDTPCKSILLLRLIHLHNHDIAQVGYACGCLDRACHARNAMHSDSMLSVVIYGYEEYIFACSMLFRLAGGYTQTHEYASGVTRSSAAMRCK